MSYTSIYRLWPDENRVEEAVELRNSHGSAPIVWGSIMEKYLGVDRFSMGNYDRLWPLWKDERLTPEQRAILLLTYDNAMLAKAHYRKCADDIDAFMRQLPTPSEYANHWPAIAEFLRGDPDCPFVGFRWTSVCCNPFQGAFNDEKDDYDAPDWSKYWSVYDEFNQSMTTPVDPLPGECDG